MAICAVFTRPGDDKGKILRAAVDAKAPMLALEIGAFVGYR